MTTQEASRLYDLRQRAELVIAGDAFLRNLRVVMWLWAWTAHAEWAGSCALSPTNGEESYDGPSGLIRPSKAKDPKEPYTCRFCKLSTANPAGECIACALY